MLKILVDGEEVVLFNEAGSRISMEYGELEVVWEFPNAPKGAFQDHGADAQIHHKFTTEGVIVTGQTNERVFDISHGLWDDLAQDGGMI